MSKPFILKDEKVFVTISIGIAGYPSCGKNAEALIQNADTALYRAKSEGRNNYKFFETEMNMAVSDRMTMINDLRHAVHKKDFILFYQPLIDTSSNKVTGVEALLRWHHPERGLIPAKDFVPLLEETGLIISVGEWVLNEACRQNMLWQQDGLPPVYVSVNLSVRQFHKCDLVNMVVNTLKKNQLDPHLLQLEVTESILMDNTKRTLEALDKLRKLGVRLAIDDFGTGYSSISYLKEYPFNILKFDQSFVQDMEHSINGAAIVAAVINLGHSINMSVVAEGVETHHQLNMLNERGCDHIQGHLFAHPMSAKNFTQWMKQKTSSLQKGC